MRFEVVVDDARGMPALEAARQDAGASDMPSFVQGLMDKAVTEAQAKYLPGPLTFPEALARIAELEGQNADLAAKVSAAQPAAVTADAPAQPVPTSA